MADDDPLGLTRAAYIRVRAEQWALVELAHEPGPESAAALASGAAWNIGDWWEMFPHVRELLEGHQDRYIRTIVHAMVHRVHHPARRVDNPSWRQQAISGDERVANRAEIGAALLLDADGSPRLTGTEKQLLHLRLRAHPAKLGGAAWVMGIPVSEVREIALTLFQKLRDAWD